MGELAKDVYGKKGKSVDLTGVYQEEALKTTQEVLSTHTSVIIFEAAVAFENLLVRVDILKKNGSTIELIEVKSKKFKDEQTEKKGEWPFKSDGKGLYSEAKPYILDVAFQTYVSKKAMPQYTFKPYLCVPKHEFKSLDDGLNQMYPVVNTNPDGKTPRLMVVAQSSPEERAKKGEGYFYLFDLETAVSKIIDNTDAQIFTSKDEFVPDNPHLFEPKLTWQSEVHALAKLFLENKPIPSPLSKACKSCQFRDDAPTNGKKSGFHECWQKVMKEQNWKPGDPFIFELWRGNSNKFLHKESGKIHFLKDIPDEFLDQTEVKKTQGNLKVVIKSSETHQNSNDNDKQTKKEFNLNIRQQLQVQYTKNSLKKAYFDVDMLFPEMKSWKFPYNFIDFETTQVALPFFKGMRPYEMIAFQFSHHTLYQDGTLEHTGEFLLAKPGVFPNFDFLKALKNSLETNQGHIFRYAHHEAKVIKDIVTQLQKLDVGDWDVTHRTLKKGEIKDLIEWGESIVGTNTIPPSRGFVDLCQLVTKHYYHPLMGGSNSLKKVLPAILNASSFLQKKYSQNTYGWGGTIPGTNFKDQLWVQYDDKCSRNGISQIIDPYTHLPELVFDKEHQEDPLYQDSHLANGGAAMTAYAKLQFEKMHDNERKSLEDALLKYCELDTLATVMLVEYWQDELGLRHKPTRVA